MGRCSFLSASGDGGSLCCSAAETGLGPWQLTSGAYLTHFVLSISFLWHGSISHLCLRTSPHCDIRKRAVREWEAIKSCVWLWATCYLSTCFLPGLKSSHCVDFLYCFWLLSITGLTDVYFKCKKYIFYYLSNQYVLIQHPIHSDISILGELH